MSAAAMDRAWLNIAGGLTAAWLIAWGAHSFTRIAKRRSQSVDFLILVHAVLSGLPLLLDVLVGQPEYSLHGLTIATSDQSTALIYDAYVAAAPVLWWKFRLRVPHEDESGQQRSVTPKLRPLLLMLMVTPLLGWVTAPEPELYFTYGAGPVTLISARNASEAAIIHHNLAVVMSARLALVAAVAWLLTYRRPGIRWLVALAVVFVAVWLDGKRNSVVLSAVMLGYVAWHHGWLRGRRLIAVSIAGALALAAFSYAYKIGVRGRYQGGDPTEIYGDVRIDYGRDHTIKFTLYAWQHPEEFQILEYPGQSFLYYALIWVPRPLWDGKPLPYAQYFTSAVLMRSPEMLGWGLTTSWLEECVANVGIFGFLLGPLSLLWMCRLGDRRRGGLVQVMTIVLGAMLLAVEASAILPLIGAWLAAIALSKKRPFKRTARGDIDVGQGSVGTSDHAAVYVEHHP